MLPPFPDLYYFVTQIIWRMEILQVQKGVYTISTDPEKLNIDLIHHFLSNESYWAKGIPRQTVERSIQHSLCFGVFEQQQQVGFARVVTDYATFAWIADVFILPAYRRQGLSKWLVQTIRAHPGLQGLRRWLLATADAHQLYAQYGFTPLPHPERFMEVYQAYQT
jgi:N-acetylglutamate synthase-like GNAT family acetyltransferase